MDPDVIEYFKNEADRPPVGYQAPINQTLREAISNSKSSDPIEKLLKDKTSLKRLKAKLETV